MQAFQNQFNDFFKNTDMSHYTKFWQDGMKFWEGACPTKNCMDNENMAKLQEHLNGIWSSSMKGMEMIMEAAHQATEATQEIMKQRFEMMQKRYMEWMNLSKDLINTNDPEAAMSKQVDFTKKSMESAVHDFKDMTDTVSKAGMEVFSKASEKMNKTMSMHKANKSKK